jgi:hypothetical protein
VRTYYPLSFLFSGAIFAAGILNTLDGRNHTSARTGIGGLLQTADYIAGLSGSAWLIVSWAESELAPLFELVLGQVGTGGSSRRAGWFTQYNLFDVCIIYLQSPVRFLWHLHKICIEIVLKICQCLPQANG